MDKIAFGVRVRAARRRAGLSSDALAELCDCTPVSIRQIESGSRLPSLPKLMAICNALKITPDELLGQELAFPADPAIRKNSERRLVEAILRLHSLSPQKENVICSVLETLISEMERLE